jgi:hypothetical protein
MTDCPACINGTFEIFPPNKGDEVGLAGIMAFREMKSLKPGRHLFSVDRYSFSGGRVAAVTERGTKW